MPRELALSRTERAPAERPERKKIPERRLKSLEAMTKAAEAAMAAEEASRLKTIREGMAPRITPEKAMKNAQQIADQFYAMRDQMKETRDESLAIELDALREQLDEAISAEERATKGPRTEENRNAIEAYHKAKFDMHKLAEGIHDQYNLWPKPGMTAKEAPTFTGRVSGWLRRTFSSKERLLAKWEAAETTTSQWEKDMKMKSGITEGAARASRTVRKIEARRVRAPVPGGVLLRPGGGELGIPEAERPILKGARESAKTEEELGELSLRQGSEMMKGEGFSMKKIENLVTDKGFKIFEEVKDAKEMLTRFDTQAKKMKKRFNAPQADLTKLGQDLSKLEEGLTVYFDDYPELQDMRSFKNVQEEMGRMREQLIREEAAPDMTKHAVMEEEGEEITPDMVIETYPLAKEKDIEKAREMMLDVLTESEYLVEDMKKKQFDLTVVEDRLRHVRRVFDTLKEKDAPNLANLRLKASEALTLAEHTAEKIADRAEDMTKHAEMEKAPKKKGMSERAELLVIQTALENISDEMEKKQYDLTAVQAQLESVNAKLERTFKEPEELNSPQIMKLYKKIGTLRGQINVKLKEAERAPMMEAKTEEEETAEAKQEVEKKSSETKEGVKLVEAGLGAADQYRRLLEAAIKQGGDIDRSKDLVKKLIIPSFDKAAANLRIFRQERPARMKELERTDAYKEWLTNFREVQTLKGRLVKILEAKKQAARVAEAASVEERIKKAS